MIALHAERVADDPQAVRWVLPSGTPAVGRVRSAPGRLGELLDDGTLRDALAEPGALWLWLCEGQSWARWGAPVQGALRAALADPGGWVVTPAPGEVLARVTADLLDGSVGDFVRSHGGSVRAERVGDDAVALTLGGACEHCAAAEHTLRSRLMEQLRRRCPDVTEVERGRGQLILRLAAPGS